MTAAAYSPSSMGSNAISSVRALPVATRFGTRAPDAHQPANCRGVRRRQGRPEAA